MSEKILFVEGSVSPVSKVRDELSRRFDLTCVVGVEEALAAVQSSGPFAVVLADLKQPKKDGLALFSALRQAQPHTVRLLQIVYAEQDTAVAAVADDIAFRFVVKPLSTEALARALYAGLAQHRLLIAERTFLTQTLHGVIQALTDVLSLANPAAFGRAQRIQGLVARLSKAIEIPDFWEVDMAAMLSHIGCVSLPAEVLEKIALGQDIVGAERKLFESHPTIGAGLLENIPRMGGVAQNIRLQHAPASVKPPYGARVLKVVLDFDMLSHKGIPGGQIIQRMRGMRGTYDEALLNALASSIPADDGYVRRFVGIRDLKENMILVENIVSTDGMLLLAKGAELNEANIYRLIESKGSFDIKEPVGVLAPVASLM